MYHELVDDFSCDIDLLIKTKVPSETIDSLPPDTKYFLFVDGVDEKRLSIDEHISIFKNLAEDIHSYKNCERGRP